jgi:hypothetical protein
MQRQAACSSWQQHGEVVDNALLFAFTTACLMLLMKCLPMVAVDPSCCCASRSLLSRGPHHVDSKMSWVVWLLQELIPLGGDCACLHIGTMQRCILLYSSTRT